MSCHWQVTLKNDTNDGRQFANLARVWVLVGVIYTARDDEDTELWRCRCNDEPLPSSQDQHGRKLVKKELLRMNGHAQILHIQKHQ